MKRSHKFVSILLLTVCCAVFLTGCNQVILFDPKGPVGDTERLVIISSFALMLIVVIPVFIMAIWFPWKYRASNTRADYAPKWSHSTAIESIMWLVPAIIVTILGIIAWKTTHQLDPHKPIDANENPITIEAVSLDWKWLFIYPDQQIATVNQLVFPANVPLSFKLTSGTVMTSFFIPQLGSQIYAMAGMQTQLHLMADEPGTYTGQNQQFSGDGYADMHFKALAVSPEEFESWVNEVRQSPEKLDLERYTELEQPVKNAPMTYFSTVKPDLFSHILGRYNKGMVMHTDSTAGKQESEKPNHNTPEKN